MGGRRSGNIFNKSAPWYERPLFYGRGQDWGKFQAFGRANPTAPPPAKGRSYDDYIKEYNAKNPPKPAETTAVPAVKEPEKPPTPPEANLVGAVQLAPSGQLGSSATNTAVEGAPQTPQTPQTPQATAGAGPTTSPASLSVGQLSSPTGPGAAQTGSAPKPMGGAGESTAQYNTTAITPQTGPSTTAPGINPAAAAAAARRINQNVSSQSQYLMPSISGLRFGGY